MTEEERVIRDEKLKAKAAEILGALTEWNEAERITGAKEQLYFMIGVQEIPPVVQLDLPLTGTENPLTPDAIRKMAPWDYFTIERYVAAGVDYQSGHLSRLKGFWQAEAYRQKWHEEPPEDISNVVETIDDMLKLGYAGLLKAGRGKNVGSASISCARKVLSHDKLEL